MSYAKQMPESDTQRLAMSVARLNRRLRQERQSELSVSQLSVLGALRLEGTATPSALAARERVSAPSVTRTLNCLEERGLIERTADPHDRRSVVVTISQLGEKVLAEERRRRDEWLTPRLKALTVGERVVLREAAAIMTRLAES